MKVLLSDRISPTKIEDCGLVHAIHPAKSSTKKELNSILKTLSETINNCLTDNNERTTKDLNKLYPNNHLCKATHNKTINRNTTYPLKDNSIKKYKIYLKVESNNNNSSARKIINKSMNQRSNRRKESDKTNESNNESLRKIGLTFSKGKRKITGKKSNDGRGRIKTFESLETQDSEQSRIPDLDSLHKLMDLQKQISKRANKFFNKSGSEIELTDKSLEESLDQEHLNSFEEIFSYGNETLKKKETRDLNYLRVARESNLVNILVDSNLGFIDCESSWNLERSNYSWMLDFNEESEDLDEEFPPDGLEIQMRKEIKLFNNMKQTNIFVLQKEQSEFMMNFKASHVFKNLHSSWQTQSVTNGSATPFSKFYTSRKIRKLPLKKKLYREMEFNSSRVLQPLESIQDIKKIEKSMSPYFPFASIMTPSMSNPSSKTIIKKRYQRKRKQSNLGFYQSLTRNCIDKVHSQMKINQWVKKGVDLEPLILRSLGRKGSLKVFRKMRRLIE